MSDADTPVAKAPKRKRAPIAAFACDRCRAKKQRVSAPSHTRPAPPAALIMDSIQYNSRGSTCTTCRRKDLRCDYEGGRKEGESQQQALKRQLAVAREHLTDVVDAMNYFKSIPEADLFQLISHLKASEDTIAALFAFKQGGLSKNSESCDNAWNTAFLLNLHECEASGGPALLCASCSVSFPLSSSQVHLPYSDTAVSSFATA